jgi:hypothetical protein
MVSVLYSDGKKQDGYSRIDVSGSRALPSMDQSAAAFAELTVATMML